MKKPLTIEICMGTSCYMLGSQDLLTAIESLPQAMRQRLDVNEVPCFKACGKGPNVRVNGVVLSAMTPERLVGLIEEYFL